MVDVSIDESQLRIGDTQLQFGVPIDKYIEYDGFVVIQLENVMTDHTYFYQSVMAIDSDGSIRWKMPKEPESNPKQYANIHTKDGTDLWVHHGYGFLFEVDPETGTILDREFVK